MICEILCHLTDFSGVHEKDLCVMSPSETLSSRLLTQGLPLNHFIGDLARSFPQLDEWPIQPSSWLLPGLWNLYIMWRYILLSCFNDGCVPNLIVTICGFWHFDLLMIISPSYQLIMD